MLKKIARLFTFKSLAAFALTFLLGVLINSLSGNYYFYFTVKKTFTKAEAEAKLNKRVILNCSDNYEHVEGTVISYHHFNGEPDIDIDIKWDKPIYGKYEKLSFRIDTYSRCIIETDGSR